MRELSREFQHFFGIADTKDYISSEQFNYLPGLIGTVYQYDRIESPTP